METTSVNVEAMQTTSVNAVGYGDKFSKCWGLWGQLDNFSKCWGLWIQLQ